jgi:hypothetical protein
MRVILAQLSDIHFYVGRDAKNPLLDRVKELRGAIQSADPTSDACVLVVTGDVAYKGDPEEYEIAGKFFDELKQEIKCIHPDMIVDEVFIPGNHDCFIPDEIEVMRRALIEFASKSATPPKYELDKGVTANLQSVQRNFFQFLADRSHGWPEVPPVEPSREQLFYRKVIHLGSKKVVFHCYNTSWTSKRHESGDTLIMPILDSINEIDAAAINVTLLHHPYSWTAHENARALRDHIERYSDIIMYGHEHMPGQHSKELLEGSAIEYFEGHVLQGNEGEVTGFNVVVLDLDKREFKPLIFDWEESRYQLKDGISEDWKSLDTQKSLLLKTFPNTTEYSKYLEDPGTIFTHPAKDVLSLDDIFVYPDLIIRPSHNVRTGLIDPKIVQGKDIQQLLTEGENLVLIGAERAGKTCFAKRLYRDLQQQGYVPLMLDASDINSTQEDSIRRMLRNSIEDQYSLSAVSRYEQLERHQKILIVDNFHIPKLTTRNRNSFIEYVERAFGKVILIAGDVLNFEELARRDNESSSLLTFQHCEFRDFGYHLRGELIEKWFELGSEYWSGEDNEIEFKVSQAEKLVDILLGKNVVPSQPFYILALLQVYESQVNLNTTSGAHGYYFDSLITAALTPKVKRYSMDTYRMILNLLAYRMFETKGRRDRALTEDEFREVVDYYHAHYRIKVDATELAKILSSPSCK